MTSTERCEWLLNKFLAEDPPRFELEFKGRNEFHMIDNKTPSKIVFTDELCTSHYGIREKVLFERYDNFIKIDEMPILLPLPETDEQFEYLVNLLDNIDVIPYVHTVLSYPKRLNEKYNALQEQVSANHS